MSDRETLLLDSARSYLAKGWTPIRLSPRQKTPPGKHDFNKLNTTNVAGMLASADWNIGVMLGAESSGLVDLDFDWPEARAIGARMFSKLPGFGRVNAPNSHKLLICANAKSKKFALPPSVRDERLPDEHTMTVLEVRASGLTMFPPSIHPNGEVIQWEHEAEIQHMDAARLMELAGLTAFLAVCIRLWPQQGTRDETAMAFAGALLATGMSPSHVDRATVLVATEAGDEEAERRIKGEATAAKLKAGEHCTGIPRLVELLGLPEACSVTFREWLGIKQSVAGDPSGPYVAAPGNQVVLDPLAPRDCARVFIRASHMIGDERTLVYHKGNYFVYEAGCYRPIEPDALIHALYSFAETALVKAGKAGFAPLKPTRRFVNDIEHALRGLVLVEQHRLEPPCWIAGEGPPTSELLICRNGLLHLPTGSLEPHTPRLFTVNAIDIDFDPTAPVPMRWLQFLNEVFPGDPEAIETLQEIMGYILTPATHHQKAFMLVAPPRSGKGTIARVLEDLVGSKNFAGIKLKTLGEQFGLQSLIGKLVAVVTDARLGSRTDKGSLVETILTISGEDTVTVDRKNRDPWQGRMSLRFFLHTNELPHLEDMSGALASRFIILTTGVSFFEREDHTLADRLRAERPGILLWAIEGYRRLRERGRFVQPQSSQGVLRLLTNIASPIASFIDDCCELGPGFRCPKDHLYAAYRRWADGQGRTQIMTKDAFATKLYAAQPKIGEGKGPREFDRRPEFRGIRVVDSWDAADELPIDF